MKITEDVRKYAAQHGISGNEALEELSEVTEGPAPERSDPPVPTLKVERSPGRLLLRT